MNKEEKNAIDITEQETKKHSEFLREVIDFSNYQKKEVAHQGSKKGFLILAVDGNAAEGDGAYSFGSIGGNKEYLLAILKESLNDDSAMGLLLRRAITEVTMEHVMGDLISKLKDKDE